MNVEMKTSERGRNAIDVNNEEPIEMNNTIFNFPPRTLPPSSVSLLFRHGRSPIRTQPRSACPEVDAYLSVLV